MYRYCKENLPSYRPIKESDDAAALGKGAEERERGRENEIALREERRCVAKTERRET